MLDKVICTLGPLGTDASALAYKLSKQVLLFSTFREAISYAYDSNSIALISCGYVNRSNGLMDCWVDLHMEFVGKMSVKDIIIADTKPMALAINDERKDKKKYDIVIHPSTKSLIDNSVISVNVSYVDAKPIAVDLTHLGYYDMCIGSVDYISKYSNLRVIKQFQPQMLWAMYERDTQQEMA